MAIRIDSSADRLDITATTAIASITNFTMCSWARYNSDNGIDYQIVMQTDDAVSNYDLFFQMYDPGFGVGAGIASFGSSTTSGFSVEPFASRPSVGSWFFWYARCAGTGSNQLEAGWRGRNDAAWVQIQTQLATGASLTGRTVRLGNDTGGNWADLRLADFRTFDSVLTDNQLLQQMQRYTPVIGNQRLWCPMLDSSVTQAVKDLSGNGRNLTAVGTLTYEDGPPLAWSGQTSTPQIGIGISQSVGAAAGTTTAVGVGRSTAASLGAAVGSGVGAAVSRATKTAVGAASGAGQATGISSGGSPAVGTASGTGVATGVGAPLARGVGTAVGVGTASAHPNNASFGTAAGSGTATGVGRAIANMVGYASGGGAAASAVGSVAQAVGRHIMLSGPGYNPKDIAIRDSASHRRHS